MKRWRIFLLLLLSLLLPIRGAVAAAMLCGVASTSVQTESTLDNRVAGHDETKTNLAHVHGSSVHEHEPAQDLSDTALDGWQDHGAQSKCNVCSAFCGLTLLVSHAPTLSEPLDLAQVKYSTPAAMPPSHVSDGQERPPRTI